MPEDIRLSYSSHRLAAIMFSDIVGYTRLMGKDEDKALVLLRKNRKIQQQLVQKYDGEWLKEMGDGILVQFSSAADAVRCAIEIQRQVREELNCKIRIGIHLGDVTFENKDVFGDGVNIASRLQSISDPGGIYISETLQRAIRSKSDIQTTYLGEVPLKNVDYPVKTYSIKGEGLPIPSPAKIDQLTGKDLKGRIFGSVYLYIALLFLIIAGGWWLRSNFFTVQSAMSSLLVLPVDNYTGSDTLDYYMAGVHSSLITDIGKIGSLRVPSKTTANAYKNAGMTMTEIASELNVNYIIEPAVLCLGDSICFRISLLTAHPEEAQIWVQDYYVEKSQILNLYYNVAKDISEKINVILTPEETKLLAESRTVDPEAYDAYLKGQYYWEKIDRESMQKAMDCFELAIELDPEWADPYAGVANAWSMFGMFFRTLPKSVTLPNVYKYLNKALELDPNSAQAHYVKALIAVWTEWDWEQGEAEFLKSLELDPNDALCRMYYSHLLGILHRYDEAKIQADLAFKLDSLRPLVLTLRQRYNDDNEQLRIQYLEKACSIDPDFGLAAVRLFNAQMRDAYANGDYEKWIEIWDKKVEARGAWNDEGRAAVLNAFNGGGHIAAIEEMFKMNEKYGTDCHMTGGLKAERYLKLKNYDKAMDYIEKEYERRAINITYRMTNIDVYNQLKDNPRYMELLRNMNLPFE